ncbi:ABC transporter permease [Kitasatospora sp. NPDC056138]|uniref:ABC transporter permease n=1 Tax=Kitasatospora sp. NPDC056138 TaxID=3345724 RepID=UPI0035D5DA92
MTTATATATATAASSPLSRLFALGRAETTLLMRNRTALFMALAMPVMMIGGVRSMLKQVAQHSQGLDQHAAMVNGVTGLILMFVVYYNLTAAYVARRGELVLKRLRTGEATDLEILAGTAVPSVVLALLQCAVLGVAAAAVLHLPAPVNPLLLVAGLGFALVLLVALAALSSAFTKSVESAGITTLPVTLVAQFGSGLLIPLEVLPDQLATFCRALPTTPAFQLLRLGWFGTDGSAAATDFAGTWAEAAPHLGLAAAWTAAACWAARRWFRWEPRR